MQPHSHRSGRKWRRFLRHNSPYLFVVFLVIMVIGLVGLLFWMMTSMRFVKPMG